MANRGRDGYRGVSEGLSTTSAAGHPAHLARQLPPDLIAGYEPAISRSLPRWPSFEDVARVANPKVAGDPAVNDVRYLFAGIDGHSGSYGPPGHELYLRMNAATASGGLIRFEGVLVDNTGREIARINRALVTGTPERAREASVAHASCFDWVIRKDPRTAGAMVHINETFQELYESMGHGKNFTVAQYAVSNRQSIMTNAEVYHWDPKYLPTSSSELGETHELLKGCVQKLQDSYGEDTRWIKLNTTLKAGDVPPLSDFAEAGDVGEAILKMNPNQLQLVYVPRRPV